MASFELRKRANWQTISGAMASEAEELFKISLQSALDSVYPQQFFVERHPRDFDDIYSKYPLPQSVLNEIYNVDVTEKNSLGQPKYKWGIRMDFAIRNLTNDKILFGEIKRQDGWTESTNMQAGRGNAHERSCKYFTPGLMRALRQRSNISEEILPFWLVIVGDITRVETEKLHFGSKSTRKIILCGVTQKMSAHCLISLKTIYCLIYFELAIEHGEDFAINFLGDDNEHNHGVNC